jgi:hypothetical protein
MEEKWANFLRDDGVNILYNGKFLTKSIKLDLSFTQSKSWDRQESTLNSPD